MQQIVELLKVNRDQLVDRLVSEIVATIPRYKAVDRADLHASTAATMDALLASLADGSSQMIIGRLVEISQQRTDEQFAVSDFLRALHASFPVFRAFLREEGPADSPALAQAFGEFEARLHDISSLAAEVYADTAQRKVEAKNRALNRMVQELDDRGAKLREEVSDKRRALNEMTEFNQRVIETMPSGVTVIGADLKVRLFSSRLEQLTGLATEEVLGRDVLEAFRTVKGIEGPLRETIEHVRRVGRYPLRKHVLTMPSGRDKSLLFRGERLFDDDGKPQGTVMIVDDVTERELLIDSFSRYVSRDLLDRLLAQGSAPRLEGECRTCSVLFADIRSFTTMSEDLPPENVHECLNTYLRVMVEAITEAGGFIDKFVGDKVMAVFGQHETAVGAEGALRAARHAQQRVGELRQARQSAALAPISLGIGINTGEMLVGNVGSELRMDFTVIGDAVNVADRLQGHATGGQVLCGARTKSLAGSSFVFDEGRELTLKGRRQVERAFALLDGP